jgi:hypothetical protein
MDDVCPQLVANARTETDPWALRLAKRAVNHTLDTMGFSTAIASCFDMHHLGHTRALAAATRGWRTQSSRSNRAYEECSPRCSKERSESECLRPHLDRPGGTAATERTTGTVDLAEEDHHVVWVRACRM